MKTNIKNCGFNQHLLQKIKKMLRRLPLPITAKTPTPKAHLLLHLLTILYHEIQVLTIIIYPIYLNVGRARNDFTYHIYDITQKLRDTAHRINDVGRPVGNALETVSLDISIPDSTESVNKING